MEPKKEPLCTSAFYRQNLQISHTCVHRLLVFAEGLSNPLRGAGHVCGLCIGSFCLLAAMAGKHCSSHLEAGQSCQRSLLANQLSHTPSLTQTAEK